MRPSDGKTQSFVLKVDISQAFYNLCQLLWFTDNFTKCLTKSEWIESVSSWRVRRCRVFRNDETLETYGTCISRAMILQAAFKEIRMLFTILA